jgi:hypothetical protein
MPLKPGTWINDKYELVAQLDQDGVGVLWRAKLGPVQVVIRFLLIAEARGYAWPYSMARRRLEELNTLAQLKSDHIVAISDWGTFEQGLYLVMALSEGMNLAKLLEMQGCLDRTTAVDYVVQAAAGLAHAHKKRLVHGDLKPENLFLESVEQKIIVLGFGITSAASEVWRPLADGGAYLGTPAYLAPEQFDDVKTAEADLWALGAILYELLSGQVAFGGDLPAVIVHVREREPAPLASLCPDVPRAVLEAVTRCLRKRPRDRFGSAEELILALAPYGGIRAREISERQERAPFVLPAEAANDPSPGRAIEGRNPPSDRSTFYQQADLVAALLDARDRPRRRIVFMLGAGFSMPVEGSGGVPSTLGLVDRIRAQLTNDWERRSLDDALRGSTNPYQDAFACLSAIRSQSVANRVIRDAVLEAFDREEPLPDDDDEQARACWHLEHQHARWRMPPGVRHLGQLVAAGLKDSTLKQFSQLHFTTNFDPLLRVAIGRSGGLAIPLVGEHDLTIPAADPACCKIVHLHGRWDASDTLRTNLHRRRPQLEASLTRVLQESTLVVLGYGGWEDVFMSTLRKVAERDAAQFDILWGFHEDESRLTRDQALVRELRTLCRGHIQFYQRVDTNEFFGALVRGTITGSDAPKVSADKDSQTPKVRVDEDVQVTVFRPRSIASARWYQLLAFVHVGNRGSGQEDPLEEVERRVQGALGEQAKAYRSTTEDARLALPAGGSILLVPVVEGVEFNPPSRAFAWHEPLHEERFQLRAGPATIGQTLRGKLSAYLGTVLLAEVTLSFLVTEQEVAEPQYKQRSVSYRKIFASYSHQDAPIVRDFDRVVQTFGDRYLLDVKSLRAGEVWSEALERLIADADIFQLFWSESSMRSKFCRQEWEYALEVNCDIRPVFWQLPMPRDEAAGLPPARLAKLHFARLGAPEEGPPSTKGTSTWSKTPWLTTLVVAGVFLLLGGYGINRYIQSAANVGAYSFRVQVVACHRLVVASESPSSQECVPAVQRALAECLSDLFEERAPERQGVIQLGVTHSRDMLVGDPMPSSGLSPSVRCVLPRAAGDMSDPERATRYELRANVTWGRTADELDRRPK